MSGEDNRVSVRVKNDLHIFLPGVEERVPADAPTRLRSPMQLHIWHMNIDHLDACSVEELGAEERERAERFHHTLDRDRFVAAHCFFRYALGQHLGVEPAAVRLAYTAEAKPFLAEPDRSDVRFNFARAGASAACVVASSVDVGIDIERALAMADMNLVADRIMTASEVQWWRTPAAGPPLDTFYRAWTRKEALGKAEGHGISPGPQNIVVPLDAFAEGDARIVAGLDGRSRWSLSDLQMADDLAGAVAFRVTDAEPFDAYRDETVVGEFDVPTQATLIRRTFRCRAPER